MIIDPKVERMNILSKMIMHSIVIWRDFAYGHDHLDHKRKNHFIAMYVTKNGDNYYSVSVDTVSSLHHTDVQLVLQSLVDGYNNAQKKVQ